MATADLAPNVFEDLRTRVSPRTVEILEHRDSSPSYRRRGWLVRRALLGADVFGLSVAFVASELVYHLGRRGTFGAFFEVLLFLGALPVWILAAKIQGLYERDEERTDHSTTDDVGGVVQMVTVGMWSIYAFAWLTRAAQPPFSKVFLFWVLAVVAIPVSRALARALCRRHILYVQNAVILGAGTIGQTVALKFVNHPEYGVNVAGFVDTEAPSTLERGLEHVAYLGPAELLDAFIDLLDVERVVVAFPQVGQDETLDVVRQLGLRGVQVDIVPRLYDLISPGLGIHSVEGLPLIGLTPPRMSRSSLMLKRGFDVIVAGAALTLLAPLFPIVAWRIKRESNGPVFFRQQRMGYDDRPFEILKFRTMVANADSRKSELAHLNRYSNGNGGGQMFKVDGDPRVTRVGRQLRRRFFDELPQLINVLRGDMSLVGPRPLILEEDGHVDEWGRRRLALKPGMTGSWQVLGRNAIGFEEMVRLDYIYVSNWSLWQDFRLICRTVPLVLKGDGGTL